MHLDDQILNIYIDNELSDPWKAQVEEHLEWCEACKKRLEELKNLHELTQKAELDEEDIKSRQDRVLRYMDKNIINKKRFSLKRLFHKIPKAVFYPALTACLTFCFCLIIFNSPEKQKELLPTIDTPVNLSIESITPVRTTDNYTTIETLNKYSLDDILKYLDGKGYDVEIRVKSLTPISTGEVIINSETSAEFTPRFLAAPTQDIFPLKVNNLFLFKASQENSL